MPSVLIAVPTFESVDRRTFESLWELDRPEGTGFATVGGYDCAKARNEIAKKAMEGGWDYVLMVDSDMVIPHDALRLMLEGDADIVLAPYARKGSEGVADIFKWSTGFGPLYTFEELDRAGDRIQVPGGGFGCALIKTSVFREMAYPYFVYALYPGGDFVSEDLYLCLEATRLDMTIECDTRVRCGHIFKEVR